VRCAMYRYIHTDTQTHIHTDTDTQTHRQTHRHTDRHTDTHIRAHSFLWISDRLSCCEHDIDSSFGFGIQVSSEYPAASKSWRILRVSIVVLVVCIRSVN
jgi:hypothetical protein